MKLIINNSSMQPIYEQIVEQVKEKILKQEILPEEILPSVRSMAKDLRISALTVKKAYDALEQEGFILTVQGKGSFVASMNQNLQLEEKRRTVEQILEQAIRAGRSAGMSREDIRELFELLLEE